MHETRVRTALGLIDDEALQEQGVYWPDPSHSDPARRGGEPPEPTTSAEESLLPDQPTHAVHEDSVLTQALPGDGSRALRMDFEPRVLILTGLPAPLNSYGSVRRLERGDWVMDSRDRAGLVLPLTEQQQLAIWAEGGAVRLFELRPQPGRQER